MTVQRGKTIAQMNTELLFVRHCESHTNVNNDFSCRVIDHGLTQRGMEESVCTALLLSRYRVSKIYSSPLRRAKETAAIIGRIIGLDTIVDEALREVDVGSIEGQPTSKNWQLHNAIVDAWKQGQWDIAFPAGENFYDLVRRIRLFMEKIIVNNPMKRLVVITHGAVILSIRYGLCGEDIKSDTPTGSVIRVQADLNKAGPTFRIESGPIIDHLTSGTTKSYEVD